MNEESLSMRGFRDISNKSLWQHLGGSSTLSMIVLGLFIGFLMGYDQATNHLHSEHLSTSSSRNRGELLQHGSQHYDPMATPLELLGHVRKQRQRLLHKLQQDYGEYASVLTDRASLDFVFKINEASRQRFHRRLILKILGKQENPSEKVKFTWVTAGDQRASGKGNLPIDSYTDILQDTTKDAFAAVGLTLQTKNRAFDGYGSGPALGLCMETVYGSDIDILSWDFQTTDGTRQYRAALWGTRAIIHPSRPLLMMIDHGPLKRWKQMFRVDGKQRGVAMLDTQHMADLVKRQFPDSSRHDLPETLPPALRYLKCHGSLEGHFFCKDHPKRNYICNNPKGDICRANKYIISDTCKLKKYQTDWMPGW